MGGASGREEARSGEAVRSPWLRSERPFARRVVRPLQEFLAAEQSGGVLLLAAALVALAWANSPFRESYTEVWHTPISVRLGGWSISQDLQHWVNDGLMTLFFFVVGLEIKRELTTGELREPRAAALPVAAAVGGMVVPALLYLAFNPSGPPARGWGIPMATDIAFALGVLALAGKGLPSALKTFLLALAIVDDIGAITVIALFYSGAIAWEALGLAAGLLLLITVLQRLQVRWTTLYIVLGVGVWLATFESGVHATISGVALGLMTPAVPFQRPAAVSDEARRVADDTQDDPYPPDADAHHWLRLASLSREAVSPLGRLEHLLHPWTSYVVVPLFALANAGVSLSGPALERAAASSVSVGVIVGLVLGKAVGVTLGAWVGTRLGARLPERVRWTQVGGVAVLAGIGFTVSLFISVLAFTDPALQDAAKVGVLTASLVAGVIGSVVLRSSARAARRRAGRQAGR